LTDITQCDIYVDGVLYWSVLSYLFGTLIYLWDHHTGIQPGQQMAMYIFYHLVWLTT